MSDVRVSESGIHGKGVFAKKKIRNGARIIEYRGRRIPEDLADDLYGGNNEPEGIILLFTLENGTVIDAAVDGNDARFINHSCDPNCEAIIEGDRVFIHAVKTIRKGEELTYDYSLTVDPNDTDEELLRYMCRCGAKDCRGSMLDSKSLKKRKRKRKAKGRKK